MQPLFVEERNSSIVKKVRLKGDEMPFYLISLIEHKAQVDYNVVMQILRYLPVQLRDSGNADLLEKKDGVSILMLIIYLIKRQVYNYNIGRVCKGDVVDGIKKDI